MNREEITKYLVDGVNKIIPGDKTNGELLRANLDAMSVKQFDAYIRSLGPAVTNEEKRKRGNIPFYRPNLSKGKIDIAHMYRLCEDIGHPIEQRLIMTDPVTGVRYLTPHKYPCMDIVVGRQSQTIGKKRSIPDRTQQIDDLTGQPTSTSKGSRISSPEAKGIGSRGLVNALTEFVHVRGGSVESYREMSRNLVETGACTINQISGLSRAKSTLTLAAYLNACHIGNNVNPDTRVPEEVYS